VTIPQVASVEALLHFLQKHLEAVSFSTTWEGSSQAISHNVETIVQFDTETAAANPPASYPAFIGTGYDATTYKYRAPYAGRYYFYTSVVWYNMAATLDYTILYLNHTGDGGTGTTQSSELAYAPGGLTGAAGEDFTQQGAAILDLSKGDLVYVSALYFDAAVATEHIIGAADARYTQFFGYKI